MSSATLSDTQNTKHGLWTKMRAGVAQALSAQLLRLLLLPFIVVHVCWEVRVADGLCPAAASVSAEPPCLALTVVGPAPGAAARLARVHPRARTRVH